MKLKEIWTEKKSCLKDVWLLHHVSEFRTTLNACAFPYSLVHRGTNEWEHWSELKEGLSGSSIYACWDIINPHWILFILPYLTAHCSTLRFAKMFLALWNGDMKSRPVRHLQSELNVALCQFHLFLLAAACLSDRLTDLLGPFAGLLAERLVKHNWMSLPCYSTGQLGVREY